MGDEWEIRPSPTEVFILKLRNNKSSRPYVTLLDLMPNGDVKQHFPEPTHSREEARLAPGQELTIPVCLAVLAPAE